MENADHFWISEHRQRRLDWAQGDALKLQKEYSRKGKFAPAWFLGSARAAQKLKEKHPLGEQLLASTELAEMASRREVAQWRFSRLAPHLANITGLQFPASGAGLDTLHFLELYPQFKGRTWAGDLNPLTTAIAKSNLAFVLGSDVGVCRYDALQPPFSSKGAFVFLDPARRHEGERLERYQYEPDLDASLKELEKASLAQIKCSPGETPERLAAFAQRGWIWEWVQRGRDIVECFGTWQGDPSQREQVSGESMHSLPVWTVTCLDGAGVWISSYSAKLESLPFSQSQPLEIGQILILPKAVLHHSQLFAAWLKEYRLNQSEALGLCTGEHSLAPLCDSYRLIGIVDSAKHLKRQLADCGDSPLELRSLEHPMPKDWLEKISPLLRQKGDPALRKTLLITRRQGRLVGLLLETVHVRV